MAASSNTTSSAFPFKSLPREIRDKIYPLLLTQDEPIRLKDEPHPAERRASADWTWSWKHRYALSPSICRVSRQLAREALPVLYSNTFIIDMDNISRPIWDSCQKVFIYRTAVSRILLNAFDRTGYELWEINADDLTEDGFYFYHVDTKLKNAARLVRWLRQFTAMKYLKINLADMPIALGREDEVVQEIIKLGGDFPTTILEIDGLDMEGWEMEEKELQEMRELEAYIISSWKSAQKAAREELKEVGSSFPFKRLPAEIRIKIYEMLLLQENPIRLGEHRDMSRLDEWRWNWTTHYALSASICRVSKQLAAETLPVLYSNTFVVDANNTRYQPTWEICGKLWRYRTWVSRVLVRPFDRRKYEIGRMKEDNGDLSCADFEYLVLEELRNAASVVRWVRQFSGVKDLKIDLAYAPLPLDREREVVREIINLAREFPTAVMEIYGLEVDVSAIGTDNEDYEDWQRYSKEMEELNEYINSSWKSAQEKRREELKGVEELS